MSTKTIIFTIILVVVVVGFMFYDSSQAPEVAPVGSPTPAVSPAQTATATASITATPASEAKGAEHTIAFLGNAFSPKELTIKKGDTVIWQNESDIPMWPATAMHPTHKNYPGSDIKKCGTAEESTIFDACKGISPGSSYSFKFSEVGEWGYHDHLKASVFGKIIVTE